MIIKVDYDDIAGIFPDYPEEGEGGPQEMFEISAADIEVIFCYFQECNSSTKHFGRQKNNSIINIFPVF